MIQKEKGNEKIHRLRVIQLMGADYNFVLALVFGHRMMKFARQHCNLNDSQYGSMAGKRTQSAVLNKVLTYDILWIQRKEAATAEFDAVQCYDRIIPALVMVACRRLGLGEKAGKMMFNSLNGARHNLRTAHRISDDYGPEDNLPHFGTGQGSGGSPTFWLSIADVLFQCIDEDRKELILTNHRVL